MIHIDLIDSPFCCLCIDNQIDRIDLHRRPVPHVICHGFHFVESSYCGLTKHGFALLASMVVAATLELLLL